MNLQQMRTICAIADNNLRLSLAAAAVGRSQPAVTRQLQDLESQLGIKVFVRSRNRILDITPAGRAIIDSARRIVDETDNIARICRDITAADEGELRIATTHTQARYVLPEIIGKFMKKYPRVRLSMREGNPAYCCSAVESGATDIGIATDPAQDFPELMRIPCYRIFRSVVVPARHPLTKAGKLTLREVNKYPLIVYDEAFSSRRIITEAFGREGLTPNIVLSAIDADVSKRYVEMGLGVAIVADVTFDAKIDRGLRRLEARHLFAPSVLNVFMNRRSYARKYVVDFVKMLAPHANLTPAATPKRTRKESESIVLPAL